MHAAEHEGRAVATAAPRRHIERHSWDGERLKPARQPLRLGGIDAGIDAAIRIVS
jgi:hypothetical protein